MPSEQENDLSNQQSATQDKPPAASGVNLSSGAQEIATLTKGHIEKTTQFMLEAIEGAEARLSEAKEFVLADCARLKAEMDGMVASAEAIVLQSSVVNALVEEIKSKRATVLNPGEAAAGMRQQ